MEVEWKRNETNKQKLLIALIRKIIYKHISEANNYLLLYDFEGDVREISIELDYRPSDEDCTIISFDWALILTFQRTI